jgi:hypothetical protein
MQERMNLEHWKTKRQRHCRPVELECAYDSRSHTNNSSNKESHQCANRDVVKVVNDGPIVIIVNKTSIILDRFVISGVLPNGRDFSTIILRKFANEYFSRTIHMTQNQTSSTFSFQFSLSRARRPSRPRWTTNVTNYIPTTHQQRDQNNGAHRCAPTTCS